MDKHSTDPILNPPPIPKSRPIGSTYSDLPRVQIPADPKLRSRSDLRGSAPSTTPQRRRPLPEGVGRSVFTDRDNKTVAFVDAQGGATYEHLAVFLGRQNEGSPLSDSGVRQWVRRMERFDYVRRVNRLGRVWVTITVAGSSRVGHHFQPWPARETMLAHTDAANRTRLWWESDPRRIAAQGMWISERLLWSERGRSKGDWHVPDAVLRPPDGGEVTAVEIELHVKTPRSRYVEIFDRMPCEVGSVLYLCPERLRRRLGDSVDLAREASIRRSSLRVFVRALPNRSQS